MFKPSHYLPKTGALAQEKKKKKKKLHRIGEISFSDIHTFL